jgi:hypothetical protein
MDSARDHYQAAINVMLALTAINLDSLYGSEEFIASRQANIPLLHYEIGHDDRPAVSWMSVEITDEQAELAMEHDKHLKPHNLLAVGGELWQMKDIPEGVRLTSIWEGVILPALGVRSCAHDWLGWWYREYAAKEVGGKA